MNWKRLGGYSGVVLMITHAVLSAYWAAGGTALLNLLSDQIAEMADERSAGLVLMLWGVVLLKSVAAFTGLVLLRNWFSRPVRSLALVFSWMTAIVLTLYATLQIAGGLAMITGLLGSASSPDQATVAYLLLWAPLWLVIGLGFFLLSWEETFQTTTRT